MFPFATAILPLFLRVRDFGLLGTSWAVIITTNCIWIRFFNNPFPWIF